MTPTPWHVDPDLMARYAGGAALDHALQGAVETHLTECGVCRVVASGLVRSPALDRAPVLDRAWGGVRAAITVPAPSPAQRWLERLGLPERDAVVLRASSALHRPAILSIVLAFACAVGGASAGARLRDLLFLLVAPLIPVLAVAAAYDTTDPLRELTAAAPASKLRIALLRAAAALSVAVPLTCLVGMVVPGLREVVLIWLLPSLALTVLALLLLTWWSARIAAGVVGGAWIACALGLLGSRPVQSIDTPMAQAVFALVAVAATAALVARTSSTGLNGGYS